MEPERGTARSPRASLLRPDWLVFLQTLCAFAEGTAVLTAAPLDSAAATCVAAVLTDPLHRMTAVGGREGMPRSLASVLGGSVTRFVGGFRGVTTRAIATPGLGKNGASSVAVTRDGVTLLVSDYMFASGTDSMFAYSVCTGAFLRVLDGRLGAEPFFRCPCQIWVASDGFVFIADWGRRLVHVLTPQLTVHSLVGEDQLPDNPTGVCANDDIIAVTEFESIAVFDRGTGTLLRRFGSFGFSGGQLHNPDGLCFWPSPSHIAVAEWENGRVSIFTVDGEFVRHIGVGKLRGPIAVACSDANELVVADCGCVVVLSESGDVVWMSDAGDPVYDVAVHGSTIYAQTNDKCVVYT